MAGKGGERGPRRLLRGQAPSPSIFTLSQNKNKQVETVMPRKGQRPMLDPTCTYLGRWIRFGYIHTYHHDPL